MKTISFWTNEAGDEVAGHVGVKPIDGDSCTILLYSIGAATHEKQWQFITSKWGGRRIVLSASQDRARNAELDIIPKEVESAGDADESNNTEIKLSPTKRWREADYMNQIRFALLLALAALAGCQSRPLHEGYASPYPKGSIVAISPRLEGDAIKQLKNYLDKQYGRTDFVIISRSSKGAVEDLIIDSKGRLWKGSITEIWEVQSGGIIRKHEFIMYPDGRGGNFVGFKEAE